ncbi:WD repeat-containing protein 36 [Thelohanellus kitauei]|uniref:WD repeat-containing protein 36 n=1 Tax=Thelohanellus kitauei TaxID=669202 RepID=A0A0C2IVJ2_THEKT|nr:WD repeat-containing protein 36 [Thelohanellus kitauei]
MLCEGLTTLSLLPDSRWRYLDKIDLIKLRSQPSEPVKKIESAPFFLPTTTELNPTFEIEETAPEKRRKVKKKASSVTLVKHLAKHSSSKRQEFLCVLMNYSPFELDVQLEFLADSDENIEQFLDIMKDLISTYENFEFVQGILALFLKVHSCSPRFTAKGW